MGVKRAGQRAQGWQENLADAKARRGREGRRMSPRSFSSSLAPAAGRTLCWAWIFLCAVMAAAWAKESPAPPAKQARPASTAAPIVAPSKAPSAERGKQELFRGKVVFLREALTRRKIEAREEFDKQVALETAGGELIPIVPDWRGRAFYQDARLRNRDVELVGKRQKGVPYLQVLMIFVFDEKGRREYMDYYCDTCAFPMYEIKPCECCQGPVRLRLQPRDLPDYIKARFAPSSGPVRAR
jgi:hypothetical protein